MEDEELSSLVQNAEQMASQLDDGSLGELPRVERNLRQIMDASHQLWMKTSQGAGLEAQGCIFYLFDGFFFCHCLFRFFYNFPVFCFRQGCFIGLHRLGPPPSCSQVGCAQHYVYF